MPVMPAEASKREQQEANTFQALRVWAVCTIVHHFLRGSNVKRILLLPWSRISLWQARRNEGAARSRVLRRWLQVSMDRSLKM